MKLTKVLVRIGNQRKRGKRSEAAIIKRKRKYVEKQVGPLRKEDKMLVNDLQQKNFELTETRKRLLDCQIATKKLLRE